MKRFRFVAGAIAAAAAVALSLAPRGAQAQTIPFSSGIQVQNLSSTGANISIAFYPLRGTAASASVDATIPANGQVVYATLPSAVAAGFDGSAVISSDQRIAAIANIVSPDLSLTFGGEAYIGVTQGSSTVSLPLLFKGVSGFNTFFNVQNVGQTATNVTVTYTNGATESFNNLAPGASVRFDQATNTNLPAGFVGAATVTSSASDIAAVVTQVGPTTMLIYNGFSTSGSTAPVFPLVNANNAGFITGISIQNTGSAATDVTVSYTPAAGQGTACTETQTIPPGASRNFAVDAFRTSQDGETCANGALFVGSGRVTGNSANQNLVAIVNQLNQGTNKAGSYSGFDASAATDTVVFPLVQDRVAGFFTGLSIYNAGSVTTTIECSYTNAGDVTQSRANVAPGETFAVVQNNAIANGYNGSGTCRATAAGARIVGIANQLRVSGTSDTFFVYEGVNN
ncbi:MAG: hypothetical protein HXY37_06185 [Chloroflexi bacterium]|nr:hypothetical protein [Chloroflexota bacterium]